MKISITNHNCDSPENIFYFFSIYFIFLLHRSVIGLILIFNESLLHKDPGRMQKVPTRVKIVVDHVELDAVLEALVQAPEIAQSQGRHESDASPA